MREPRHCEERSDEANQAGRKGAGLLRYARNDGAGMSSYLRDLI
jgi:hypothetical protein